MSLPCISIRLLISFILFFISLQVSAANFESLLMPGELIEGHAKLESKCANCHSDFSQDKQNHLCLDCHDDIDADIKFKKGFHGLSNKVNKTECRSCHTDHKGRNKNIIILNKDTFDHRHTNFKLSGKHLRTICGDCHKPTVKYRNAGSTCYSCHKEDDRHKGALGKECNDCHKPTSWSQFKFNHKNTDFPLVGKHIDTDCNSCHLNQQYNKTPVLCNSCHKLNDVHSGRNGRKCQTCHSPKKWNEIDFNHDDDTKFPLRGKHRKQLCTACHSGNIYKDKLKTSCINCHQSDDKHKGRNGNRCDNCHRTQNWKKVRFNHDKDTDFSLAGKHKKVPCSSCHRQDAYKVKLKAACINCHQADDVHKEQLGKQCDNCHNNKSWGDEILFDHGLSRFPLIGQHSTVACEECHLDASFKDTASQCVDCHAADDAHKRRLPENCALCHTPNSWLIWQFEHDSQTNFTLDGAHTEVHCHDCHRREYRKDRKTSDLCYSCHEDDDIHRGGFGENCERCHNTHNFNEIIIQ